MGDAPVVTLDGPSGTGKGTVGRIVAARLVWHYLDSGAVYRVFGCMADDAGISPHDIDRLTEFAAGLRMNFSSDAHEPKVFCNDRDLTAEIRTERCGELASRYAVVAEVRALLLGVQRAQRRPPGLVADGRDMGTTVFPDAPVKIYLHASADERAERRYKQLKAKGLDVNLARLRRDMAERDARDAGRAVSPLAMAAGATRIDTTELSIEAVVAKVLAIVEAKVRPSP